MSNGLAIVFFDVLAIAACRLAGTDREKKIAFWFAEHDMSVIGNGVEFDLADLNWSPEEFENEKKFLLEVIHQATDDETLARLPYEPDQKLLGESLSAFARMIRARAFVSLSVNQISLFHPAELPTRERCARHGVYLRREGCLVCNNSESAEGEPQARPLSPLESLLGEWTQWSRTAEKSEDGWESDFPKWRSLMTEAEQVMLKSNNSIHDFKALEGCWAVSNESEQLCEFSKNHVDSAWNNLAWLGQNGSSRTRWQVYETMSAADTRGEEFLRAALSEMDSDPYCLRRALLSLSDFKPNDAEKIAKPFLHHSDPAIAKAARILHDRLMR